VAGRKWALRRLDDSGATAELIGIGPLSDQVEHDAEQGGRRLLVDLVRDGERVWREPLADSRDRHRRSFGELPISASHLSRGEQVLPSVYETEGEPQR